MAPHYKNKVITLRNCFQVKDIMQFKFINQFHINDYRQIFNYLQPRCAYHILSCKGQSNLSEHFPKTDDIGSVHCSWPG